MKNILLFFSILICAGCLFAQANSTPVRLALISETDATAPAVDILTANLSSDAMILLLERNQIEKVYQEQSLSAGNQNYLKLGQLLGADGLVLFDVVRTPQATNFMARLIAVKPGVILADASFDWPLKDTAQWTESAAAYLKSFLPKLKVLQQDAIPISVVNLRSAISSVEAAETERQVKLLSVQILSQEPQFFVLERQKMQLLCDEKELKADDSAFWNGSYLLEGTVDQNGYSPDTVTINARLTPPNGGTPILMEASGSRTNLAAVIKQLVVKVNATFKVDSTVPTWSAADEAAKFFIEANWALRWGVYCEAEAAADSAWALGKQDLDCALVRVKANVAKVEAQTENPEAGTIYTSANDQPWAAKEQIHEVSATHLGVVFDPKAHEIDYVAIKNAPNPQNIDGALRALELYFEFSRTSADGHPKTLESGAGWNMYGFKNHQWRELKAIDGLTPDTVSALALDGHHLWVGGFGYLALLDLANDEVLKFCRIQALAVDHLQIGGGYAWVQFNSHLYRTAYE